MIGDGTFDLRIASSRGSGVVALLGPQTTVVINVGVGPDRLARLLARAGRRLEQIDAVLLSNERAERIAGLPALLQRHPTPVFATGGTARSLTERYAWTPEIKPASHGDPHLCGNFVVTAFDLPGRGAHPVGWRIETNGLNAAFVLDAAAADHRLGVWMQDLDLLVIDAHYDENLLGRGTVDQQRVLPGGGGRLSNTQTARLVAQATWRADARVVLVDLDPELNDAAMAQRIVQSCVPRGVQVGAIPGHADDVRVRLDVEPTLHQTAVPPSAEPSDTEPCALARPPTPTSNQNEQLALALLDD